MNKIQLDIKYILCVHYKVPYEVEINLISLQDFPNYEEWTNLRKAHVWNNSTIFPLKA